MESEAERIKTIEGKAPRLPLLEWAATPNNRRFVFIIRRSDPRPADPSTGRWWGACMLEVEWRGKGEWEWRVWPRHFRGTGSCCAYGTAGSAKAAQAAAARVGLERLEDLMDDARGALAAYAASASAA